MTEDSSTSTDQSLFFFQAEDGIRDLYVTGVQTCALPISFGSLRRASSTEPTIWPTGSELSCAGAAGRGGVGGFGGRSEERRVGKECRSRWAPDPEKKKKSNSAHFQSYRRSAP